MSGQLVKKTLDPQELATALRKAERTLETFVGSSEGAQRALKVAFVLVRRVPELQRCTVESIVNGVLQSAQFGLELGSEAYLVPFWNDKLQAYEAQWIADWKGLVRLAVRTGALTGGHGDLVYQGDEYVYRTTADGVEFVHDRRRFGPRAKEDNVKAHIEAGCQGVYFLGYRNGAPPVVAELSVDEVEYVRRTFSRKPDSPLWEKRWSAGAIKTAAKQALKTIPLSPQLAQAIEVDNRHETGIKSGVLLDEDDRPPLKEPQPASREADVTPAEAAQP